MTSYLINIANTIVAVNALKGDYNVSRAKCPYRRYHCPSLQERHSHLSCLTRLAEPMSRSCLHLEAARELHDPPRVDPPDNLL